MPVNLEGRHFLTLKDFSAEEITYLVNLSKDLKVKKRAGIKGKSLEGKNVVLIFEKSSTRTRCAFETAAFDEGGCVTFLTNSQMGKKESIEDTAKVLGRYYDGIEFRGYKQETVEALAKYAGVPVWNGLTDKFHPTQILADFLTITEHVDKPLHKVKLVFVGDANNVARSLGFLCAKLGVRYAHCSPRGYGFDPAYLKRLEKCVESKSFKLELGHDPQKMVKDADAVYADVWASMGQEKEAQERHKAFLPYQVNEKLMKLAKPDAIALHCLPAHRGQEITDGVMDGPWSAVYDQAENRMHTERALLTLLMG